MLKSLIECISSMFRRLRGGEKRLAEDGLRSYCSELDPGLCLQESTRIERWGYFEKPRPRFPGFFKHYECLATVSLPPPLPDSGVDVFEAIRARRSRREYSSEPISLEVLSTILYYSVGLRGWELGWPLRHYPSAGGLQPVEVYVVAWSVEGLEEGLYHYEADSHRLCGIGGAPARQSLVSIALDQEHVGGAPLVLILTVVYARSASKYGARAYKYVHVDLGAVMQNIYLVVEALGLATVAVGAFYDRELCRLIDIDCRWEMPVLLMPVGKRAEEGL